jgi:flagellar biosynthesis/type III secretory pathway protein FliH
MMSTIIKAGDGLQEAQGVPFNFDDLAAQGHRYLEKVRREALQIVAKAQKDAQALRQKAEVEGRKAGQAAVEQSIQKQLGSQLTTLMPALRQAIEEIRHARQTWLIHWEKSAIHVAAAIAGRLARRELSQHPEIPLPLIREALELAAGGAELRLHLSPGDLAALKPQVEALLAEFSSLGTAELIADPQVTPGGCRVETRFGTIDQQFEAQLERIEEELT